MRTQYMKLIASILVIGFLGTSLVADPYIQRGYDDSAASSNSTKEFTVSQQLKKIKDDLNKAINEIHRNNGIITASEKSQITYLRKITQFSKTVDSYIKQQSTCLNMEDKAIKYPRSTEKGRAFQQESIDKCYQRALSTTNSFKYVENQMNIVYIKMLELKEMSEDAGVNIKALRNAIKSMRDLKTYLEIEG